MASVISVQLRDFILLLQYFYSPSNKGLESDHQLGSGGSPRTSLQLSPSLGHRASPSPLPSLTVRHEVGTGLHSRVMRKRRQPRRPESLPFSEGWSLKPQTDSPASGGPFRGEAVDGDDVPSPTDADRVSPASSRNVCFSSVPISEFRTRSRGSRRNYGDEGSNKRDKNPMSDLSPNLGCDSLPCAASASPEVDDSSASEAEEGGNSAIWSQERDLPVAESSKERPDALDAEVVFDRLARYAIGAQEPELSEEEIKINEQLQEDEVFAHIRTLSVSLSLSLSKCVGGSISFVSEKGALVLGFVCIVKTNAL